MKRYINLLGNSALVSILVCALFLISTACTNSDTAPEQLSATGTISNTQQINKISPSTQGLPPTKTSLAPVVLPSPTMVLNITKTTEPITPTPTPTLTKSREISTQPPLLPTINLNNIAHAGGNLTAIALIDKTAFVGEGLRLTALQFDAAGFVKKLGSSNVLPGVVEHVIIFDGIAFVVAGEYIVQLSIEDPANISVISDFPLGQTTKDIIIHNDILYTLGETANGESVLSSINITDRLSLVDTIPIKSDGANLALVAETLFISHSNITPLSLINISNPSELNPIGEVELPSESVVLSMQGFGLDTLVVATEKVPIVAFDMSVPLEPRELWRKEKYAIINITDFSVNGERLIMKGLQPAGSYIPNYGLFLLPSPLPPPTYLHSSTIANDSNTLYIADGSLMIFMIQDTELVLQAGYTPTRPKAFAVNGNNLYGFDGDSFDGVFKEWELASLTEIREAVIQSLSSSALAVGTLSIVEDKIFIASDNELQIVDTNDMDLIGSYSSVEDPILLFQQSGRHIEPAIIDDVVYVQQLAITGQEELGRYDISVIDDIQPLEPLPLQTNYRIAAMVANNRWLVVSLFSLIDLSGNDRILLYDLNKNPIRPVVEVVVEHAPSVMIIGEEILITGSGNIDSNRNQITLFQLPALDVVAQTNSHPVQDIVLVDDIALVTYKTADYVEGFSMAHSNLLDSLGVLATVSNRVDMVAANEYLVLGNQVVGLLVFEIER